MPFEDYTAPAGGFDLVLLQESSQYLDPAILFCKAYQLLVPGGRMLILDQFALRQCDPAESLLHYGLDFIHQAETHGFGLREHIDLSRRAMPTLDYILKIIDAHKDSLLNLLPIEAVDLAGLRDAVAANRRRYHESILGYALYDLAR
jgi:SAM-dependent methyltransferase